MPTFTGTGGSASAATHLLVLVERAEALRAELASDAQIAHAAAERFDEQSATELTTVDLGSCCRLVHWALVQASNALVPLTEIANGSTATTRDVYLATCEDHRELLQSTVAAITAIRHFTTVFNAGNERKLDEHDGLGGLCQSLQFSAAALTTLKQLVKQTAPSPRRT